MHLTYLNRIKVTTLHIDNDSVMIYLTNPNFSKGINPLISDLIKKYQKISILVRVCIFES
jgi:hypothetical protein